MKNLVRMVAVVAIASVSLVGVAEAHVRVESTSITLKVTDNDTRVPAGTKVTFTAKASSAWDKCYQQRKVNLYRDGEQIAREKTNNKGKVSWVRKVTADSSWYVKLPRKKFDAPHPHRHECEMSQSPKIKMNAT